MTCGKVIKCVGNSTKGLHTHLASIHDIDLLRKLKESIADASVNADVQTAQPGPAPMKMKITSYFLDKQERSLPSLLSRMMACNRLPFSIFFQLNAVCPVLCNVFAVQKESQSLEDELQAISHAILTAQQTVAGRGRGKHDSMVSVIRQETSLFEGGGRGRILQLVYDYLLSVPPTSVESERAFSKLELFVQSCEPVWVKKHWTICACYTLSFRTKLRQRADCEGNDTAICKFCIIINQF